MDEFSGMGCVIELDNSLTCVHVKKFPYSTKCASTVTFSQSVTVSRLMPRVQLHAHAGQPIAGRAEGCAGFKQKADSSLQQLCRDTGQHSSPHFWSTSALGTS